MFRNIVYSVCCVVLCLMNVACVGAMGKDKDATSVPEVVSLCQRTIALLRQEGEFCDKADVSTHSRLLREQRESEVVRYMGLLASSAMYGENISYSESCLLLDGMQRYQMTNYIRSTRYFGREIFKDASDRLELCLLSATGSVVAGTLETILSTPPVFQHILDNTLFSVAYLRFILKSKNPKVVGVSNQLLETIAQLRR